MKLGIVGSEQAKFTETTEAGARDCINWLFQDNPVKLVVSGGCHLGGVDDYAMEEALINGITFIAFPPKTRQWSGGYKNRNVEIAKESDLVVCITVRELPDGYTGMRFPMCYHCKVDTHVKSGGCWTVKYARSIGKQGSVYVVNPDGSVSQFS